jgi:predicted nucleic acid-binding protein
MDGETFRIWAQLMHGTEEELYEDAMIAATAIQHGMTVVTRNVRDFEVFKVPTLNPFLAG